MMTIISRFDCVKSVSTQHYKMSLSQIAIFQIIAKSWYRSERGSSSSIIALAMGRESDGSRKTVFVSHFKNRLSNFIKHNKWWALQVFFDTTDSLRARKRSEKFHEIDKRLGVTEGGLWVRRTKFLPLSVLDSFVPEIIAFCWWNLGESFGTWNFSASFSFEQRLNLFFFCLKQNKKLLYLNGD